MPIVTLTTDFGLSDSYVAQMKGAMLSIAPEATLIDVTHQVFRQDCAAASAILADAVRAFPPGTIHLAVVDPGVGSERRAVAVETMAEGNAEGPRLVAPDNGVLTDVVKAFPVRRAVQLTEKRFWRRSVSQTFHGRDIFGPVAAHWSRGVDLSEFGPALETPLVTLPADSPTVAGDTIQGRIVRTDSFGNLITNIDVSLLPTTGREKLVVELGEQRIVGIARYYGERAPGELLALIGSSGHLEVAVCMGHAGEILAAWSGDILIVKGLQKVSHD
jgi:S-adenosyl-L-methionine hydrolase (adenosine-forming)